MYRSLFREMLDKRNWSKMKLSMSTSASVSVGLMVEREGFFDAVLACLLVKIHSLEITVEQKNKFGPF